MPLPLCLATASISSINTIQGAWCFASAKRSRTREAPTPTYISTKSEPEILKNGTPASPAIALAIMVLPVPGGPTRITPFGMRAPMALYFSGSFRKSTISASSPFSSVSPATSSKWVLLLVTIVARLLPKSIKRLLPPCGAFPRISSITSIKRVTAISTVESMDVQSVLLCTALTV